MTDPTLSFQSACEFLGLGETKMRALILGGYIPTGKLGSKRQPCKPEFSTGTQTTYTV